MTDTTTALPVLTGASDKQVAFATDTRAKQVAYAEVMIPAFIAYADETPNHSTGIAARYIASRLVAETAKLATVTTARDILDGAIVIPADVPVASLAQRAIDPLSHRFGCDNAKGRRSTVLSVAEAIVAIRGGSTGYATPGARAAKERAAGNEACAAWIESIVAIAE